MIKGFRQIVSLTMVSRIFGLVRDICYTHFIGPGALLDAWTIAFKIPNLARRLFGEGAASASLIPVYSQELHRDPREASLLINTVVTMLLVILASIIIIGEVVIFSWQLFFDPSSETQLVLHLSSIMLPYMLLVCIVAILGGILNVHKHFAAPAAAPIILNIFIISSIFICSHFAKLPARQTLFYTAFAVVAAGIGQLYLQYAALKKLKLSLSFGWSIHLASFKRILFLMGPMILGLTATQLNTLSDDLIGWIFSASPEKGQFFNFFNYQLSYPLIRGSVTHLYCSQRLYQLPLGVFGISIATALFPVISKYAAKHDHKNLTASISSAISATLFIAIPSTIGLAVIARPLISLMFEHGKFTSHDTSIVTITLIFYSIGLTGYFAQQILARSLYSINASAAVAKSAAIAVGVNIILNLILIWPLHAAGLALATAICSYIQVTILLRAIYKKLGADILQSVGTTLIKTLISTLIMSAVLLVCYVISLSWPNFFRVLFMVSFAGGSYLLSAKLLKTQILTLLTGGKDLKEAKNR